MFNTVCSADNTHSDLTSAIDFRNENVSSQYRVMFSRLLFYAHGFLQAVLVPMRQEDGWQHELHVLFWIKAEWAILRLDHMIQILLSFSIASTKTFSLIDSHIDILYKNKRCYCYADHCICASNIVNQLYKYVVGCTIRQ